MYAYDTPGEASSRWERPRSARSRRRRWPIVSAGPSRCRSGTRSILPSQPSIVNEGRTLTTNDDPACVARDLRPLRRDPEGGDPVATRIQALLLVLGILVAAA